MGNLWISHVLFCSRKASWSFANMWNQLPVALSPHLYNCWLINVFRHVMNFLGEITLFGKYMVSKWLANRLVSWFLGGISSMSSSLYGISEGDMGMMPFSQGSWSAEQRPHRQKRWTWLPKTKLTEGNIVDMAATQNKQKCFSVEFSSKQFDFHYFPRLFWHRFLLRTVLKHIYPLVN